MEESYLRKEEGDSVGERHCACGGRGGGGGGAGAGEGIKAGLVTAKTTATDESRNGHH